jgi:uncharacterized integral membrane protein
MADERNPSEESLLQKIGPRGILAGVIGIVVLVFIIENTRSTKIRFIGPQVKAPLWLALVIAAALGAVAGLLIDRRRTRR